MALIKMRSGVYFIEVEETREREMQFRGWERVQEPDQVPEPAARPKKSTKSKAD